MSIRSGGKEMSEGEKNIVYNLRYEHKEKVADVTDIYLLRVYDKWNQSDKADDFLFWLREIDWSAESWSKQ